MAVPGPGEPRKSLWERLTSPVSVIGGLVAILATTLGLLLALGVIERFGPEEDGATTTTPTPPTTPTTGHPPTSGGAGRVTVPDLTGVARATAEKAVLDADLVPSAVEEPSSDIAEDRVVRTLPAAGEQVDRGSGVRLVVSSGPPVPMPDVVLFLQPGCQVIPGGALSGADVLNLLIRVQSQGQVPFDGNVQVVARSDTGLNSPKLNVAVRNTAASVAVQVDVAPQDYGRVHRFTITADADGKVDESNEANNIRTVTVRLPSPRPTSTFDAC